MTSLEFWDSLPEHPNYLISDLGNVWSLYRDRELKQTSSNGYYSVELDGKRYSVHRLVAALFCDKPENCDVVNHLDRNKLNNRANNLDWTTHSGNSLHAKMNSRSSFSIRGEVQQTKYGKVVATYPSVVHAARAVGIGHSNIYTHLSGRRNHNVAGSKWRYVSRIEDVPEGKEYHGYIVTKEGRVYSKNSRKYMTPQLMAHGYQSVVLSIDGKKRGLLVHRLVATLYLRNPDEKKIVNHKNGVKTDNGIRNLEWATRSENAEHSVYSLGNGTSKEIQQLTKEGNLVGTFRNAVVAAKKTGILCTSIRKVARGQEEGRRAAGGYIWRYTR